MKTYDLEELLIKLTEDTIKDVVEQYRDDLNDADVGKRIELAVAKQLAKFVPDKWTKIEIETYEMGFDLNTLVQFTDDDGDTVTAVHNEESVLMLYPEDATELEYGTSCIADSATLSNGYLSATFQVHQQDLIDQIMAPTLLGVSGRCHGEKPEDVGFGDISWIRDVPAASTIDNCGTSGWTEEKTLTIEDLEEVIEKLQEITPPEPRSWTDLAASNYNTRDITDDFWFTPTFTGTFTGLGGMSDYYHNKVAAGMGLSQDVMAGYNAPYELEYKCEFTPEDLDELTDLINKVQSEEMKF